MKSNISRKLTALLSAGAIAASMMSLAVSALDPVMKGDVETQHSPSVVNMYDLTNMSRYLFGKSPAFFDEYAADVNGDGKINVFDYVAMKRQIRTNIENGYVISVPELTAGADMAQAKRKKPDSRFTDSQTDFAVELLKKCIDSENNVLVSPYSAQQALCMTANGADGTTKTEMEQVLGGGMDISELNKYMADYRISQPNFDGCKLLTANSVWAKKSYRFADSFLSTTKSYYGSEIYSADFNEYTLNDINLWTKKHTDGMIPKLLSEFDPNTVMALINAVTFDAKWSDPFEKDSTFEQVFTDYAGDEKKTDMMHGEAECYISDKNAEGFIKYYRGGRYAFAAILPNDGIDINDYVSSLTADKFKAVLDSKTNENVVVAVPRFKNDYSKILSDVLSEMGMPTAFNDVAADFSKMTDNANSFFIGMVLQKTHIDVDEEGTKAAAATAVMMKDTCVMSPKEVKLNRPFLYAIVDTKTNIPIFIGTELFVKN